jgi:hypothetical protein
MKLWNFSIGMRRNSVYNGRKNRHRSFTAREEVGMAQSVKVRHFTEGRILPLIIKFTVPLMLTGMLRLLFNTADTMMVGRWGGDTLFAARARRRDVREHRKTAAQKEVEACSV